ncbi:MAG: hypothetical protein CFK52_04100 [Chloracidobacterium sp. CP2_5A]|nr:MAG: hypothetical protein CFK52_04100 [Chloracidobacterium sp. CP2_5A]
MTTPAVSPSPVSDLRQMWWPADLVIAVHTELGRSAPDDVARILYRLGRSAGARFLRANAADLAQPPASASLSARLRQLDAGFADAGWGRFDVIPLGAAVVISHYDSPVAGALRLAGPATAPVDDFFSGLFAELATRQSGQAYEGVEIACLAAGAASCRFVIGEASVIRKVYAWLTYPLDSQAILRRLADETAQ